MQGEIRFIKGRLKFGGHKNSAPFPSAIVVFRAQEISVSEQALEQAA
jgi:site-specific DNA-methyltransferase (adenine-specific)